MQLKNSEIWKFPTKVYLNFIDEAESQNEYLPILSEFSKLGVYNVVIINHTTTGPMFVFHYPYADNNNSIESSLKHPMLKENWFFDRISKQQSPFKFKIFSWFGYLLFFYGQFYFR